jgi:predicted lipoprotein with Yx(FWY)xxD motif
MKNSNLIQLLAVLFFLNFLTTACKTEEQLPSVDVTIKDSSLGKILTDGYGKTLYFFTKDVAGTSNCSGGCLDAWPIFSVQNLRVDASLTTTDFSTITRADGKKQVTYKGWPLYYFASDATAGDVKGENVNNVWVVAKTSYSIMLANTQLIGNDGKLYDSNYKEGTADTQYLVDDMGRTLYGFINDKKNKNNYTRADFSNDATWPIFTADLKDIPSTLDKTLFGTIDVFGKKQLTYRGWPLYYFGLDNKVRGATKGVSVPRPGVWPILQKTMTNAPE